MKTINPGTKEAASIIALFKDLKWSNKGSIYEAYGKPSATKISVWESIARRALETEGYNKDLRCTSANCYFFSTIYSYTRPDGLFIVYDTPSGAKIVKLEKED